MVEPKLLTVIGIVLLFHSVVTKSVDFPTPDCQEIVANCTQWTTIENEDASYRRGTDQHNQTLKTPEAYEKCNCKPSMLKSVRRKRQMRTNRRQGPRLKLPELMATYTTPGSRFYRKGRPFGDASPVDYIGIAVVGENEEIPVYMHAMIKQSDINYVPQRDFEREQVDQQMVLMGQLEGDELGHLLAHSLGGTETKLNIVPQARALNRGIATRCPDARGLRTSVWIRNEFLIKRFLEANSDYKVDWSLAVVYPDMVNPNWGAGTNQFYRPSHFTLEFKLIKPDGTYREFKHIFPNSVSAHCGYEDYSDQVGDAGDFFRGVRGIEELI